MTKMAAMPIYGKNLKKSSPESEVLWSWNLACSIGDSVKLYKVYINDDPGLTLTYFMSRSNLVT